MISRITPPINDAVFQNDECLVADERSQLSPSESVEGRVFEILQQGPLTISQSRAPTRSEFSRRGTAAIDESSYWHLLVISLGAHTAEGIDYEEEQELSRLVLGWEETSDLPPGSRDRLNAAG